MRNLFVLILCFMISGAALFAKQQNYGEFDIYAQVLTLVEKEYVDETSRKKLIEGSIRGLVKTLDPFSSFLTPEDLKLMRERTSGQYAGIGVEVAFKNQMLYVISAMIGSPAYRQGIRSGDLILKIEGKDPRDLDLEQIRVLLKGKKGSSVSLKVKSGKTLKSMNIVRQFLSATMVDGCVISKDILFIRIRTFHNSISENIVKEIKRIGLERQYKGLIIDLRSNPGGLLSEAVKTSDLFLDKGVIVSTIGRTNSNNQTFKAKDSTILSSIPTAVLINNGTASAAEILAAAFQDNKAGMLIGERSYGKGLIQEVIEFPSGYALKLTVAKYFTPLQRTIQGKGLVPDIEVKLSKALSPENFQILSSLSSKRKKQLDWIRKNDQALNSAIDSLKVQNWKKD